MAEVINFIRVFKRFGQREILKGVDLTVDQGDIFGFLGPNGAGKTTTIRIALGLLHPTSGKAAVLGENPENKAIRRKIGAMLDVDGLYNDMSAYDNLLFYAKLYRISNPAEKVRQNVQIAGLTDRIGDKVGSYSKGMRQRLSLSRMLLHDPELLVLDEPTAGVDPTGQIEIRQILLDMAHRQNKTVFFSSHNLDEVQRICNRIALIDRGEIRLAGELAEIEHRMSHGEVTIETVEPVPVEVMAELKNILNVTLQSQEGRILRISTNKTTAIPSIVHLLDSRGVQIEQVKKQEASIEDIYSSITKEAEGGYDVRDMDNRQK